MIMLQPAAPPDWDCKERRSDHFCLVKYKKQYSRIAAKPKRVLARQPFLVLPHVDK